MRYLSIDHFRRRVATSHLESGKAAACRASRALGRPGARAAAGREMLAMSRRAAARSRGEGRQRLGRDERERLIVEGAVRFFAEEGFEGQTRRLAARLGITQPLLYRYFPSKRALVERVYQEVFVRRCERKGDKLVNTTIKTYPNVSQFWTYDEKWFLAQPVYSRDYPPLKS